MTVLEVAAVLIILLLALGWRLSWLATRVDRAHARAERTWAALDAALVRRAQRATELVQTPAVDPASALLVSDAAAAALEPDLDHQQREQAESDLSHVLEVVGPALTTGPDGLVAEQDRASLSRRLHNDAVATARALRRRRVVRTFRLAGHAQEPQPFEMADGRQLLWPRDGS